MVFARESFVFSQKKGSGADEGGFKFGGVDGRGGDYRHFGRLGSAALSCFLGAGTAGGGEEQSRPPGHLTRYV